jgi:uncharacterized protein (DUF2249 family)
MARRKSSGEAVWIFIVLLIGGAIALFQWIAAHIVIVATIIGALVALMVALRVAESKKLEAAHSARVQALLEKYKKKDVVDRILNQEYWTGQSTNQLADSIGDPAAIDRQVLKTKTKETWKYHEVRKGQFALKIEIENGKVIGWTSRD